MRTISDQTAGRTAGVLGGSSRIVRLAKVLGGVLFCSLFNNPAQALVVIGSGQYVVNLSWDRSSSINVTGYRIYYGTASGNYLNSIAVGNMATDTVSGLSNGVTYFFAITACNTNGQESTFSNEIIYTPGTPAVQLQLRAAPNRQFVLTAAGLIGHTYDIMATQTFTNWCVIGTVTLGASGSLEFTDTNAASFSQRFYRTRETP